jgi:hypothetical protein
MENNHGTRPETTREVPVVEWRHCYEDSWRGLIVAAAFAH